MTGKLLAGVLGALVSSGSAAATPVTWAFEGYLTYFSGEPDTEIALHGLGVTQTSPFHGQIVFEAETPDADLADFENGWYPAAISLFEITIAGYHAAMDVAADNGIVVSVDPTLVGPYGLVRATSVGPGATGIFADPLLRLELPGSPLNPVYTEDLVNYLVLPPPGLVEYAFDELFIAGIDGNIFGNVTSISVVPEPALLAPFALAVLAIRRWSAV